MPELAWTIVGLLAEWGLVTTLSISLFFGWLVAWKLKGKKSRGWPEASVYGAAMAAALLVILNTTISSLERKIQARVVPPPPPTLEENISTWLESSGYNKLPVSIPSENDLLFHINFLYAGDTINIASSKKTPYLLELRILSTNSADFSEWWNSKNPTEQQGILNQTLLRVGLDPAIGFQVKEVNMGGGPLPALMVNRNVYVDSGFSRARFFQEIEFLHRHTKLIRSLIRTEFEEESRGHR